MTGMGGFPVPGFSKYPPTQDDLQMVRKFMQRFARTDLWISDGLYSNTSRLLAINLSATPGLEFSGGALKVKIKASAGVLIGADGLYVDTAVVPSLTSFNDHSARHENGGADEISIAGLSGLAGDAQTPTAHASSHNAGGADAMAIDAVAGTGSLRTLGTASTAACAGNDARLSDARTPTSHASSHNAGGGDALAIDAVAGTGSLRTLGTASTAACAGNDSRLSDARTPTAHATSHQNGGSDEISVAGLSGLLADGQTPLTHTHAVGDIASLTAGVLLGRTNASGGVGQEITPGAGLAMSGQTLQAKDAISTLQERVKELEKELDGYKAHARSVNEALNMGNGSYRP